MKFSEAQALKKQGITQIKKWGSNDYRVRVLNENSRPVWVGRIDKPFYKKQIEKQYSNTIKNTNASKIAKVFKNSMIKKDQSTLKAINTTSREVNTTLGRFERIRKDIIAPADKKLLFHIKDNNNKIIKSYHLNDRVINVQNLFVSEEDQYSSGADVELEVLNHSKIEIEWIDNPKRSQSARKNFFRYNTKTEYELEKFQVYYDISTDAIRDEEFDPLNRDDDYGSINYPCFLYALLIAGVDPITVVQISQTMFSSGATTDFIKKTAKSFNLCISVKQYLIKESTGRADTVKNIYGEKTNPIYYLGSVGQHLFAIKPTKITKNALDYPELVSKHQRTDFIVKSGTARFNSDRIKLLDSYEVISYLYHNREKLLDPITQRCMPHLLNNKYQEVRELNAEDFHENNFKELGRTDTKIIKNGNALFKVFDFKEKIFVEENIFNIVYFDFETLVKDEQHVPYCVSYCIATINTLMGCITPKFSETKNIYGFDCAEQFLSSLPSKSCNLLWAHNAGFDCRFILKHLSFSDKGTNMIDSGTKLKQLKGFYKGRQILIKDTMSFLSCSLSKLPEMFKDATKSLKLEKECFPHNLINETNYQSMWPLEYLNDYDDKDILIKNATVIGAIRDNLFDCKKYAEHYCNRDVDVLQVCFEEFRKMIHSEYGLDVYRFLSISSISIAYQFNEGCFDDCYEMNSVLLGFLRQATVGGRVMTRDNQKHHIKHKLADFDKVSLYPAAMAELDGYVRGKAKLFKNSIPSDADFYVARVKIDSIGIERHFPLQSYFENDSRNFSNDFTGRTIILGKQALEDFVEFQGATYTVIEGLYWNEGFNNQICKTITKMFNARLEYKKQKNPIQNVIKLMMNSSYGKLLMKPIIKKKVFVSGEKDKVEAYTRKNIHRMISRTPITDNLALFEEHKALSAHYAPVHLGIQVLDSSKHIMNRVMCLAEDINADIWYQDTDSMHIDYDAVEKLANAFKDKYDEDLIGTGLKQFHVDFELKGSKGNIFATESIFLGKKSYLDILACDGNDTTGMHIRMKGIPGKLLEEDTYEKYIRLYQSEKMRMNLTEACPININSRTQTVSKRTDFYRTLYFP